MTDETIEPALTPGEWEIRGVEYGTIAFWIDHFGRTNSLRVSMSNPRALGYERFNKRRVPDSIRQGVAALALCRQPYGFIWEHVGLLRRIAQDFEAEHDDPDSPLRDDALLWKRYTALRNLADRIAALLPPREHE